jgi:hypothetical protein
LAFQRAGIAVDFSGAAMWRPWVKQIDIPAVSTEPITIRLKNRSFVSRPLANGLMNAVLTSDRHLITETAGRLTGLGPGLTPSGDDFLVGFISAAHFFRYAAPFDFFLKNVKINYQLTNFISAGYLRYALEGDVSEAAAETIKRCSGDIFTSDAWIDRILETGASSGADTLFGIVAAMEVYNAYKSGEKEFLP